MGEAAAHQKDEQRNPFTMKWRIQETAEKLTIPSMVNEDQYLAPSPEVYWQMVSI